MGRKLRYSASVAVIIAVLFTGCGKQNSQPSTEKAGTVSEVSGAFKTSKTSKIAVNTKFTTSDLVIGYQESTATKITLSGNKMEVAGSGATYKDGILTIKKEGTYVIKGSMKNGQIVVDASEKAKVHIILNGVSLTCADNAPIYIKNADKVFLTLEKNTQNTLTDGKEYEKSDEDKVDGAIFSTADLTINGSGTLTVNGKYKHGIVSKDDLVITGGTFNISAVKDALNGKDCVKIKDGTFHLNATEGNGIQSKNGDDATKGYVYICGGDITVSACKEGMEGTAIIVTNGKINITAKDDGFNSASGDSATEKANETKDKQQVTQKEEAQGGAGTFGQGQDGQKPGGFGGGGGNPFEVDENCYISISGGTITLEADGDGIDSNGNVYVSGGSITVSGPVNDGNSAFDYNGTAEITGGTVHMTGSSGMAQGFSDTSTQYSILYNFSSACQAGTEVKLTDKDKKTVLSLKPAKQYQSIVISSPELKKGATYTLTCGNQTAEVKLSSVVSGNGSQGMGGMHGPGGQGPGGQAPGGSGDSNRPPRPDVNNNTSENTQSTVTPKSN